MKPTKWLHWTAVACLNLLCVLCLAGGALAQEALPEELGALTALTYNYGSFHGGEWNFTITPERPDQVDEHSPKYHFLARGFNGVALDVDGFFDQTLMDQLARVLHDRGILQWHGFAERDTDVLDGYSFHLTAQFEHGTLTAEGYERYPENYDAAHNVLALTLNAWAENGFFADDPPDTTSVFSYYGRSAVSFAAHFEEDFPFAVSVADIPYRGTWVTSTDPALIRQVFEALQNITVLEGRANAHTDDESTSVFTMADGRAFSFVFQQGHLLLGGAQAEIDGYEQLDEARAAVFATGE